MIRAVMTARLVLDAFTIFAAAKAGIYTWAIVFVGLTIADAATVWMLTHG